MRRENVPAVLRIRICRIDRVRARFMEADLETTLTGKSPDRVYEKKPMGTSRPIL
jgi:hypothetical protein